MPDKNGKGPKGDGPRDGHGAGRGKGLKKPAGGKKGGKKGGCQTPDKASEAGNHC